MNATVQGLLTVAARTMLALIFLMSALGNKIPNFNGIAQYMGSEGVPAPKFLLAGAIAFLLVGSASLVFGYRARLGAGLLFVFLVLATYYFHDFWTFADAAERQQQTIQFMKNLSMMGAMLFVVANGAGPWSLDQRNQQLAAATA
jgi:putative oxidoreductase